HDRVVVLGVVAVDRLAHRRLVRDVERAVVADLRVGARGERRDAAPEPGQRRRDPAGSRPGTAEVRRAYRHDRRLKVVGGAVEGERRPGDVDRAAGRVGRDPLLVVEEVRRYRRTVGGDAVQLDDGRLAPGEAAVV